MAFLKSSGREELCPVAKTGWKIMKESMEGTCLTSVFALIVKD